MLEWILLIIAAFLAGILNSIAGGGSFLTLPALIYAGLPPVSANATSAMAVFPGYLGAAAGFRRELINFDIKKLRTYLLLSLTGGLIGSLLLLITSNSVFSILIPWLLLFATAVFAFGRQIMERLKQYTGEISRFEIPILFLVSIYGGYFNGGLGIILLASFITFGMLDIHLMNGLKNGMSLVLSTISVLTFTLAGLVHWPQAIVMMFSSTIGGYLGAFIAKAIPDQVLRWSIVAIGLVMTLIFFVKS